MAESKEIRNCLKYTSDKRDKLDWNLQTPFFRFRVKVRPKGQGGWCGGLVVSAPSNGSSGPCLSPCQGYCVVFLRKTLLLSRCLSPQRCIWVLVNLMLGVTLWSTSMLSGRGSRNTPSRFMLQNPRYAWPDGPLGSMQTLPFTQGQGTASSGGRDSGVRTSHFPYLYLLTPTLVRPAPVPCKLRDSKHILVI